MSSNKITPELECEFCEIDGMCNHAPKCPVCKANGRENAANEIPKRT
jgi:hypothetical protein